MLRAILRLLGLAPRTAPIEALRKFQVTEQDLANAPGRNVSDCLVARALQRASGDPRAFWGIAAGGARGAQLVAENDTATEDLVEAYMGATAPYYTPEHRASELARVRSMLPFTVRLR